MNKAKVATQELPGRLVFETNPGRATKYYHLYDGRIPFSAIRESRIITTHTSEDVDPALLPIVEMGRPALRQRARALTKEEILSPEIQELIEQMKITNRKAPGVGLAAPQVGRSIQLVIIEDMDHSHLPPEQCAEKEREKVPFHVLINPKLTLDETEMVEFFEGCLSVPEFVGLVPCARRVHVSYLDEKGAPQEIEAKGWYARILQHEIDHLNGKVFINRGLLETLMTGQSYAKHWRGKTNEEIAQGCGLERGCSPLCN